MSIQILKPSSHLVVRSCNSITSCSMPRSFSAVVSFYLLARLPAIACVESLLTHLVLADDIRRLSRSKVQHPHATSAAWLHLVPELIDLRPSCFLSRSMISAPERYSPPKKAPLGSTTSAEPFNHKTKVRGQTLTLIAFSHMH